MEDIKNIKNIKNTESQAPAVDHHKSLKDFAAYCHEQSDKYREEARKARIECAPITIENCANVLSALGSIEHGLNGDIPCCGSLWDVCTWFAAMHCAALLETETRAISLEVISSELLGSEKKNYVISHHADTIRTYIGYFQQVQEVADDKLLSSCTRTLLLAVSQVIINIDMALNDLEESLAHQKQEAPARDE